jgi:hypothetical protein
MRHQRAEPMIRSLTLAHAGTSLRSANGPGRMAQLRGPDCSQPS